MFTALLPQYFYTARREPQYESTREKKDTQAGIIIKPFFFLQIPIKSILHSSFSNCSAVVLVPVSPRKNTSSQQLLSLVLASQPNSSSQQSDLAGRQGPKKARQWGSNRLRGIRESKSSTTNISGTTNISRLAIIGPRHLRRATIAPQRSSPATSRTEAPPQDPPSSGSTCTASAHGPESVRAGIGPAEAGERDPRRERARNEGRGPEIGGERIPV